MSGVQPWGSAVIVMAKAPRPGQVKTRLIPALGADGAAALALRMLRHTLAQAQAAALGPVWLCGAPGADDPAFALPAGHGLHLVDQGEGDLGQRMARALAAAVAAHRRVLMLGTDAPALDAAMLRAADSALQGQDAVFVPALDGGYALIGLHSPQPGLPEHWPAWSAALFEHLPWSTPQLMAMTRARLAAAGLRHAELPPVADVDEPGDLVHLPAHWLA